MKQACQQHIYYRTHMPVKDTHATQLMPGNNKHATGIQICLWLIIMFTEYSRYATNSDRTKHRLEK